ncbi:MAG: hypothetical protein LBI53_05805 [Candidatus Peribacteria bacterium]|jgi:hypothetical protein|nr:hypothetical protein [Candidatus Peribacteria bacterium]
MSKKVIFWIFILVCVALWLWRVYTLHDEGFFRTGILLLGGWYAFRFFFRGKREGGFGQMMDIGSSLLEILLVAFFIGIINTALVAAANVPSTFWGGIQDFFGIGSPRSQQPLWDKWRTLWIMIELVAPALIGVMCGIAYRKNKK